MPRKLPESDGDSQKENRGASKPPTSKAKVKAEMGASVAGSSANRATSRVDTDEEQDELDEEDVQKGQKRSGTRTSSARDEDDSSDNAEDAEDADENQSPNGRKRARINEQGEAVPVKKEERVRVKRCVTLPRDRDGYVPGSIVRVQLRNFVTYDFVEFRPGANLNMILGPNGTGKSSIACALCIGLNGAPSILGRSNELNAFVKHGHDKGYVELELKGKIGTPNLIIRRSINSKNRSSTFTLNGATVTGREINERITELNVQVSNLCSFLPQDRVAEFAQMSPQQLLKETQRTAGDEHLTDWHTILIEKGKELKIAQTALTDEKKNLAQLEEKQKALEKDVRRYRERREIERQIELFELLLPYVAYRESKVVYDRTKLARDNALVDYRRLEAQNRPMKTLQAELTKEYEGLEQERNTLKKQIRDTYKSTLSSIQKKNDKAASQAEDALQRLKAIKRNEKDLAKNKAKTRDDIVKLQEKVDNPPTHEPVVPLEQKMDVVKGEATEIKAKQSELRPQITALARESASHEKVIENRQNDLKQLDDVMHQKLRKLTGWDKDCADVAIWLQKNKESNPFAGRVDIPAILSVNVRDKDHVNAVEACFNANQMKTFVAHNEEDYRTFNRMFNDTPDALGRKARVTVWYRPRDGAQLTRPPLSADELRDIGFDGYAIDYVDCPEGLKWFLMKELNMHRTPIAVDSRKVDETRAQAALSRVGPDGRSPNTSYIAGDTLGMVSRSAYGQQKSMTTTRNIRPARNLVFPKADPSVRLGIEQRIAEAQKMNEEIAVQIAKLQDEDAQFEAQKAERKTQYDALNKRLDHIKAVQSQVKRNEANLVGLQKKLEDLENQRSPEAERIQCKVAVEKTVKERTKVLNEFVNLVRTMIRDEQSLSVTLLKQIQLKANVEAIDTLCHEGTAKAKRVKEAHDEANRQFNLAKEASKAPLNTLKDKLAIVDVELKQRFNALEEEDAQKDEEERWTSENVEAALETEQAKLELNNVTDAGVIAAFEDRARQIENAQANVETKEKKRQKIEDKIQKTKDVWYPNLNNLVTAIGEKFSAAFDNIGCAGEIRIAENEDYDKWAIEIYVKFREGEPLTRLTGQRQSGGERSLTTIMYLMSLTEHARAPFSLVDEINQGMDQQYERMVHDQLVKVTCNVESGQYFLITPKLLPGLTYHQGMKILCVNNGEWLPDSQGVGNMRKMIDNFVRKNRPGPSAQ